MGQQKKAFGRLWWTKRNRRPTVGSWVRNFAIQSLANELSSGVARGDHAARELSMVRDEDSVYFEESLFPQFSPIIFPIPPSLRSPPDHPHPPLSSSSHYTAMTVHAAAGHFRSSSTSSQSPAGSPAKSLHLIGIGSVTCSSFLSCVPMTNFRGNAAIVPLHLDWPRSPTIDTSAPLVSSSACVLCAG